MIIKDELDHFGTGFDQSILTKDNQNEINRKIEF